MRRISIKHGGHARSVDVRIPAGVKDGSRVRVSGEGEAGARRRGVRRSVPARPPHAAPGVRAQGRDLYVKVADSGDDGGPRRRGAGADASPATVRLKVPETTQNGQVFRLKGHGMPAVGKPDEQGRSVRDRRRPASPLADAGISARRWEQALAKLESRSRRAVTHHEHPASTPRRHRKPSSAAQNARRPRGAPRRSRPSTCCWRSSSSSDGIVPEILRKMNVDPAALAARGARRARTGTRAPTAGRSRRCRRGCAQVTNAAEAEARAAEGRLRQHRAPAAGDRRRERRGRRPRRSCSSTASRKDTHPPGADRGPRHRSA